MKAIVACLAILLVAIFLSGCLGPAEPTPGPQPRPDNGIEPGPEPEPQPDPICGNDVVEEGEDCDKTACPDYEICENCQCIIEEGLPDPGPPPPA